MTEIINLNKARKAKAKQKTMAKAQENRVIYGVSTKIRRLEKDRQALKDARLSESLLKPGEDNKGG